MAKEYQINGVTYVFSKDKFQSLVKNTNNAFGNDSPEYFLYE